MSERTTFAEEEKHRGKKQWKNSVSANVWCDNKNTYWIGTTAFSTASECQNSHSTPDTAGCSWSCFHPTSVTRLILPPPVNTDEQKAFTYSQKMVCLHEAHWVLLTEPLLTSSNGSSLRSLYSLRVALSFAFCNVRPSLHCAPSGSPQEGAQVASRLMGQQVWHPSPLLHTLAGEKFCSHTLLAQSAEKGSWHLLTAKMNQPDSQPTRLQSRLTVREGKLPGMTYLQFGIRGID